MEIYLQINQQQVGPCDLEQIATMLQNGEISADTPAWHEGLSEWKLLGDLMEIETIREPQAPPADAGGRRVPAPPSILGKASRLISWRKIQYAAVAVVVAALCLFLWPGGDRAHQLAKRIEKLDKIMKANLDDPAKGVEKMIATFEKHGPSTVRLVMELGIELARIEGDGDRQERLKEIQKTLETPMKNLAGTLEKFGDAASDDKSAQRAMQDYMERWEALGEQLASFTFEQAFESGSNRTGCIMNQRNVQQAIRGNQNMRNLDIGDPIDWDDILGPDGYMNKPSCPSGGVYTFSRTYPALGKLACTCSKAGSDGHVPDDYEDW